MTKLKRFIILLISYSFMTCFAVESSHNRMQLAMRVVGTNSYDIDVFPGLNPTIFSQAINACASGSGELSDFVAQGETQRIQEVFAGLNRLIDIAQAWYNRNSSFINNLEWPHSCSRISGWNGEEGQQLRNQFQSFFSLAFNPQAAQQRSEISNLVGENLQARIQSAAIDQAYNHDIEAIARRVARRIRRGDLTSGELQNELSQLSQYQEQVVGFQRGFEGVDARRGSENQSTAALELFETQLRENTAPWRYNRRAHIIQRSNLWTIAGMREFISTDRANSGRSIDNETMARYVLAMGKLMREMERAATTIIINIGEAQVDAAFANSDNASKIARCLSDRRDDLLMYMSGSVTDATNHIICTDNCDYREPTYLLGETTCATGGQGSSGQLRCRYNVANYENWQELYDRALIAFSQKVNECKYHVLEQRETLRQGLQNAQNGSISAGNIATTTLPPAEVVNRDSGLTSDTPSSRVEVTTPGALSP